MRPEPIREEFRHLLPSEIVEQFRYVTGRQFLDEFSKFWGGLIFP